MADKVGPFDSVPWSQAQWYAFAPQWSPSGIVGTGAASVTAGPFGVTASALSLTINAANQASKAWVRGAGWEPEAATKTATVTANGHASLSRRDRLVIRRDLGTSDVYLAVVAGTPLATPAAPTLTQSETGIWEEAVCSFLVPPASATTLTGFIDERTWLGVQPLLEVPIIGKAWRESGFSGSTLAAGVLTTIDLTHSRCSGGITFDAANNCLILARDGLYDCGGRGYATGSSGYVATGRIVRQRASVADKTIVISRPGRKIDALDEPLDLFGAAFPLKAGDKILLQQEHSVSAGQYYGVDEIAGVYLAARYVGPLSGATPV